MPIRLSGAAGQAVSWSPPNSPCRVLHLAWMCFLFWETVILGIKATSYIRLIWGKCFLHLYHTRMLLKWTKKKRLSCSKHHSCWQHLNSMLVKMTISSKYSCCAPFPNNKSPFCLRHSSAGAWCLPNIVTKMTFGRQQILDRMFWCSLWTQHFYRFIPVNVKFSTTHRRLSQLAFQPAP